MADEASLSVGVPRETFPGERRVALTPNALPALTKVGLRIIVESGAGAEAGFFDEAYQHHGAEIGCRADAFGADIVLQVRTYPANPDAGKADLDLLRPDQLVIGLANPLANPEAVAELARRKVTAFAMELVPRITRAQSMDALSSQANIGGYKAVIRAARLLPKMMPMMTTAAGTIPPARVFVLGVGVAGLQAIATARRLGAVVQAFDVRPETKEQVESLGAKFVEVPLDTSEAKGTGGYAKEQSEDFLRRQRELMAKVVAASDVVITTAQVPGRKAPVLVTADMVHGMAPGSVIVDMAAGQGGNVELSKPDEDVVVGGVTIDGPTNLPSTVPVHASMTYAKNLTAFLMNMYNGKERVLKVDPEDEIVRESLIARGGEVTNARLRQALGLADRVQEPPPAAVPAPAEPAPAAPGKDA
ncbi:MAG TPA: Re/Si-specific NAD(P)(+) transhydrogenase subunit alpha [Actinomycetota bacterium]|nr:Re/Si-specific NAD(P)(+) transhydrogenase subunit alpha [Actinomycetota bacterium]